MTVCAGGTEVFLFTAEVLNRQPGKAGPLRGLSVLGFLKKKMKDSMQMRKYLQEIMQSAGMQRAEKAAEAAERGEK